jgi:hypothetical protein
VLGCLPLWKLKKAALREIFFSLSEWIEARCQQEGLALYPVGQQPIQQAREVILALLCPLHVLLVQRNQNGLFALRFSTPAVAAGVELEPWGLEKVVEMPTAYVRRKEDAEFEKAFADAGI